jgi:hypothetical protein
VAGGDLDVAQVDPGVETGRDEGVPEHVWMCPGDPHPGRFGEPPQPAGGDVAVHAGAAAVEQDGPVSAGAYGLVGGPADRWRQTGSDDLGAFAAYPQHPVTVLFA